VVESIAYSQQDSCLSISFYCDSSEDEIEANGEICSVRFFDVKGLSVDPLVGLDTLVDSEVLKYDILIRQDVGSHLRFALMVYDYSKKESRVIVLMFSASELCELIVGAHSPSLEEELS